MKLVPASEFSFEQLVDAYNQTRVDYVVPMPMNVARLQEYTRVYDVNLSRSTVAMNGEVMLGLGMLGIRDGRTWITRLGVLPNGRRQGVGQAIMDELLEQSFALHTSTIWLEVIKGNTPAHKLFCKNGFTETRELIVARRAPNLKAEIPDDLRIKSVTPLDHEDALMLLSHRRKRPNWLNEIESFYHVKNLSALVVELIDGARGWVTYHAGLLQLTRVSVEVTVGDPAEVTAAVLHVLHQRHKRQDTITENLLDDAAWEGFKAAGYFEAFRRIEMKRPAPES
ncbi:MAG: GNAT family N-acetyltransferase [Anaerolineales bacterium]|nr:GNAT family N-acetyltransferase [Anaerolineales bacterium]MCB8988668.1 GNAT family N-acetyltransferase [Ardenticatenaceae bacterium]